MTTLHYADNLDTPTNKAFREAYKKTTRPRRRRLRGAGLRRGAAPRIGLAAVKGDAGARDKMIAAMEGAKIDSPRGPFSFSKAHNPVQDIYLRKVATAATSTSRSPQKALADPARGCSMSAERTASASCPDAAQSAVRRTAARCHGSRALASRARMTAGVPMDLVSLRRPAPERRAVRAAAVPRRQRADADLRHHRRHQPRARQLLHDRRLPRVLALAPIPAASALALVGGVAIAFALGLAARGGLRQLLYRRDHLQQVLLTYGLILVFEELRQHPVRQRRARRRGAGLPARLAPPDRRAVLSGVPASRSAAFCLAVAAAIYLRHPEDAARHDDPRRRENRDMVRALGIDFDLVYRDRVRGRRRARGARRHDRRADLVGLSRAWATRC